MFAARLLLAMSPPCADRMKVTTAPKSATANITSSSEKPASAHGQKPVVLAVGGLVVVRGHLELDGPPLTVTFPVSGETRSVRVCVSSSDSPMRSWIDARSVSPPGQKYR